MVFCPFREQRDDRDSRRKKKEKVMGFDGIRSRYGELPIATSKGKKKAV
jgi:hypothetical protein